ncbi:hydroxyacid dehydrogenase [Streptomyces sp. NPDC026672]|uniref:hydroxyacid dehydrogenase n=1 Tax=unclassified Streptomyces TaxID=2593676 RepID=UPI00340110D2
MPERPRALFAMTKRNIPHLFPAGVMDRLRACVDIDPTTVAEDLSDPAVRAALARTEVLITGWGAPVLDEAALAAAPRLRAVLHAAGSVKAFTTDAVWRRGIAVSSAAAANAVPVAEYTLAMILLTGKDALARGGPGRDAVAPGVGNLGRRVGVVGASRVGRRLLELLRPFDLRVSLADPYVDAAEADRLGVRLLPLDELLRDSDVVTLHAPDTAETRHLIGARELALMPTGAVLINTARGALLDHGALIAQLRAGRLTAVLDVTDPEPLPPDSPLRTLPNVHLTPHVAGSQGNELARLGTLVAQEAERLTTGRPLTHAITPETLPRTA